MAETETTDYIQEIIMKGLFQIVDKSVKETLAKNSVDEGQQLKEIFKENLNELLPEFDKIISTRIKEHILFLCKNLIVFLNQKEPESGDA